MARGSPISSDLRWAIIHMGMYMDASTITRYTGCKHRTVQRILSHHRRFGTVAATEYNVRGRRRALTMETLQFLHGVVDFRPDVYLEELQEMVEDQLGVRVSPSTIWRALDRTGFTMKKLTREAIERNDMKRAAFRYDHGIRFTPEQTIFVDESSFDRRTSIRGRAWAIRGVRAARGVFFVRGKRYSLLPALSCEGMIHASIVEGSFTAELFLEFIEGLLNKMQPYPAPNSVIVMDNARIHHDPRVAELIESRGMRYMYLPPYSPDYNPIELAFSVIKAYVRKHGELERQDVNQSVNDDYVDIHLYEAAYSITAKDAEGFYHRCGYI